MKTREITTDIHYVGINDRVTVKFEEQWPLPYGVSYNSYIVKGSEATVLIDTVKIDAVNRYLQKIGSEKIDYLVVNHMEPDHSGSIPEVCKIFPEMKIICNAIAKQMIKGFCHVEDEDRFMVVKDGDELNIGNHTLRFYMTPMVHWPETMMTYVIDLRVLFSGDGFGSFGAPNGGIIDTEIDTDLFLNKEMYRYYSNIVGKYGKSVMMALAKLKDLPLDYVCSTHGPVWHDKIPEVMEITRRLASYESEPGVVIIYGSMYGNTTEAAEEIAQELNLLGEKKIIIHNAAHSEMSDMISDAFRYDTLIVGSCVYSMRLFPPVEAFLTAMETREIKNKTFGGFGSFSWANGVAEKKFNEFTETLKLPLAATFSFKHGISDGSANDAREFARQIMAERKKMENNN
ncbi:MAG: FprA family A-type flavoprotein [Muribaculaceae bacterium]|nr:FprA family A-type flavoprotein [Muribaculaceae bacterium]